MAWHATMAAVRKSSFFRWSPFAAIFVLVFAVYFKVVTFGLTGMDDVDLLPYARQYALSFHGIVNLFTERLLQNFEVFYRPVFMLSLIGDAFLARFIPFSFPLTDLLIHLAASCLVFILFFRTLGHRRDVSLFFALAFAVHPALVQAVAWIPGRNDSLFGLFTLAAFIFYGGFLETGRWRLLLLHAGCAAAALYTKETAIVLFPLLALFAVLLKREQRVSSGHWNAVLPAWGTVVVLWGTMRTLAIGGTAWKISPPEFLLANVPLSLVQYAAKALVPVHLSNFACNRDTSLLFGVAVLLALGGVLFFVRKRRPSLVLLGGLWFTLFLVPVLVFNSYLTLEHRLYVPMVGLFMLLGELRLPARVNVSWYRLAAALVILLFSGAAFRHADDFTGPAAFNQQAAVHSPRNHHAHQGLGCMYGEMGFKESALTEFTEAHRLALRYGLNTADTAYNLAAAYFVLGRCAEAEGVLSRQRKEGAKLLFLHGRIHRYQKQWDKAEEYFKRSLRADPDYVDNYQQLVTLFTRQGRSRPAAIYREMLLQRYRRSPEALVYYEGAARQWFARERAKDAVSVPR